VIEVFVAFDKGVNLRKLGQTLTAWDSIDYEPVAIQVKDRHNSTVVRVAAEAIAKGPYAIVPVGSKPDFKPTIYHKGQGIRVEECSPRVH
jgi:hypothetical protein